MRALSIAALQTAPVAGDRDATLASLATSLTAVRGAVPHARLVLLPELHLSALPGPLDDHTGYAENAAVEIPGDLTSALGELAREHGLWLVPGSVYERAADGRIHNSVVVLSPAGELVATYRKVFPWQPHESCAPGDRFVIFDIPDLGRVGLAVCYDGNFPETCRQLAWMGAEVILQPTLTTTSDRAAELVMARANAIFNQIYVVSVNAASPAGLGRSVIADPEGLVRYEAGSGEELITDVLDLDAVTRVREYGTAGVSRVWEQLDQAGSSIRLPMYEGGTIRPRPSR
jgi:predicted amidohydrolase